MGRRSAVDPSEIRLSGFSASVYAGNADRNDMAVLRVEIDRNRIDGRWRLPRGNGVLNKVFAL
jgi:hypothetical protein